MAEVKAQTGSLISRQTHGGSVRRVIILGAAGRDFHNFNVFFRNNSGYRVVAFTATQIPDIEGRRYPAVLAGAQYPDGIPIVAEADLPRLLRDEEIDEVVFAYSDVSHEYVMHLGSTALAGGADFRLMGPRSTMLRAKVPVVAVTAVRTGAGKSQTTRRVVETLVGHGLRVVVIRHPMPYGRLEDQAVQRFASYEDLDRHHCTIEEREEYEPHIDKGTIVYAGVDYGAILAQAETEADVILWDGGNNDISFYWPDLQIVVADPHRAGHEETYHPGETNVRMADVVVVNKVDSARAVDVAAVRESVGRLNPTAVMIDADSPISVDRPEVIAGKRVVVVEDGPTLTHGGMVFGAGVLAAKQAGAAELVDPRPFAVGSLQGTYRKYPHLGALVPAMGYGENQIRELEETIRRTPADAVVIGTPIDLKRVLRLDLPAVRVGYDLRERGEIKLSQILAERILPLARR